MRSEDVRKTFLDYFAAKGHQVVPSSPLILPSDPTLLFANAGMNQFKEVFRGLETRPYVRASSSQKCLRVSGKHNDLEEVGRTPRHHTFFEMLGNFSFGDYFKREAILYAWELCVEHYGLDSQRLTATVFAGDGEIGPDEEAARIWQEEIGLPAERIAALGRKDNFWQMGETGPAGPCSELHFDRDPGGPADETPGTNPDRFMEIWNLVFMQYDLQQDGSVGSLPAPCVDTGMGLERLCSVLDGVESNYDTDLFQPIIQPLAHEAGLVYGVDPEKDVSLRVMADHLRAITMLVSEGVIPGPEKRGAVLRRILRRALRHGRLLSLPVPFLHAQVGHVVDILGDTFPELRSALPVVEKVVRREEERFDRTLADGFERLEELIAAALSSGGEFPGEEAFVLESERGLPLDLVRDALEERDIRFDEKGYEKAREKHVAASRVIKQSAGPRVDLELLEPWREGSSRFLGYETLRCDASRVLGLLKGGKPVERLSEGDEGEVVLDQTPFYAESGGQTGDRGVLFGAVLRAKVLGATTPIRGVTLHQVLMEQGGLEAGQILVAEVDGEHRAGIQRHHSVTHLLHAALRRVLGTHVKQAGSLVTQTRLRFDFSHFEGVSPAELREIEEIVNAGVIGDVPVVTEEMPLEEALDGGAIAFFGDRYGAQVRVVKVGDLSTELCGGTHVKRSGEIGSFRIVAEKGIAAGVRRIEAVAGPLAEELARKDRELLADLASLLGSSRAELLGTTEKKIEQLKALLKENEDLRLKLARGASTETSELVDVAGVQVLTRRAEGVSRSQRRDLADSLRQKNPRAVVVLAAADGAKAALLITVGEQIQDKVDARELIRKIAPLVGGGGGGRADLAEAGGKNPAGIDDALAAAPAEVAELLGE